MASSRRENGEGGMFHRWEAVPPLSSARPLPSLLQGVQERQECHRRVPQQCNCHLCRRRRDVGTQGAQGVGVVMAPRWVSRKAWNATAAYPSSATATCAKEEVEEGVW